GGRTIVPLRFDPAGSTFVIFRSKAPADHLVAVRQAQSAGTWTPTRTADLRILKAEYGVFPKQVDVTAAAKSLVAAGTRRSPASNEFAGDDPAPNQVKLLRVEFTLNDRRTIAEAVEGKSLELPAGAEIVKAVYGYSMGAPRVPLDVTAKARAAVAGGASRI